MKQVLSFEDSFRAIDIICGNEETAILGSMNQGLFTRDYLLSGKIKKIVLGHGDVMCVQIVMTPKIVESLRNYNVIKLAIGSGYMVCYTKENLTYSWGDGYRGALATRTH